jgi:putative serine/threonine protein kinase
LRVSEIVSLNQLQAEPYVNVLCYPKYDNKEASKRIKALKRLGVKNLQFIGKKTVFNVPVLGKGCVGIVVTARLDKKQAALKIRRVDANRVGMEHEAKMLQIANLVGVGPKLIDSSENFLLMELIEGNLLPEWIKKLSGRETKKRIRQVLREVLEQCWRLDELGMDHGELSRATNHIIVDADDQVHLVDFETASVQRRVINVTSICQYLFIRSQSAKIITHKLGDVDQEALRKTLKNYKQKRTRENFESVQAQFS